jgi:DNA-binding CsgD family transcriptional regulator
MKKISESRAMLKLGGWAGDSISLTLLFTWILSYPMHGFFLQGVAGPNFYVLGHLFTASHGLGLFTIGSLSITMLQNKTFIKLAGVSVLVLTIAYTILPQSGSIKYIICIILGFSSAYLVLAWACVFTGSNIAPELTLGVAMALTNVLLGLIGFAHNIPKTAFITASALSGLAPLISAFYITRKQPSVELQNFPDEQKNIKVGLPTFLGIAFLVAAAFFSGGLWYRAVLPLFHLKWPDIMGIGSFIYAAAVLGLSLNAQKHSLYWLGTISLSALGIGLATSLIGLDKSVVLALTLIILAAGLGALDLFFWLTLRKLSLFLGTQRSFGFGLGLSLFFITAPGIAIDTGVLTNPLESPVMSVIGACLLFLINPLLVQLLQPLSVSLPKHDGVYDSFHEPTATNKGEENQTVTHYPEFWYNFTVSEKRVYEFICKGWTDPEIAAHLNISRHTVKFHVRNLLRKAGVSNRKELLAQLVSNRDEK